MTSKPAAVELAHIAARLAAARPEASPEDLVAEAEAILEAAAQRVEERALVRATEARAAADAATQRVIEKAAAGMMRWKDLKRRVPRVRPEDKLILLRRYLAEIVPAGSVDQKVEQTLEHGMYVFEAEPFIEWLDALRAVEKAAKKKK